MVCEKCGQELVVGAWPFCPHEKANSGVIGDECDVWIRHGLCHEDGSPRHFTSKTEMAKAAAEKGLVNTVRHAPSPGTDKSKYTVRWVSAPTISEEERLKHWLEDEKTQPKSLINNT